ncbi:hypothetical protein Y032_0064g3560 [Ancylostoma ceylanicum]|uniref:Uncharacterized protein n=1 Tax=Ancylostoma ceylanicum TaxID=53326 RepID=A0A016U1G5_9BILA|nr:hypothetical protein Y032_0064g3560 [Ancylostoma ceylanicum]
MICCTWLIKKWGEILVLWWITLIVVIIFLLSGVSFLSSAYDFIGLRYRRVRAKSQLARFDDIMRRVGNGTITGTPLAPNEQVLRAVCKWSFYSPLLMSCSICSPLEKTIQASIAPESPSFCPRTPPFFPYSSRSDQF